MPHAHQPPPPEWAPPGGGHCLTPARRDALYHAAAPTEQLPSGLPPASVAGQLRVLELQRANLDREITRLRAQLLAEQTASLS